MRLPHETGFQFFQEQFHQRWQHLNNPHVRALAWLLESPDLLDLKSPLWEGKIVSLESDPDFIHNWLSELDYFPERLEAWLSVQAYTRLGRYAEKLLAFYLHQSDCLMAHGLQIRSEKRETIGEFDFLLKHGEAIRHWEFATKFYLLCTEHTALETAHQADYFVGPNLADTLGSKVRKILDKQLSLATHPAALAQLPGPIESSQALIKGWLFYGDDSHPDYEGLGLSKNHCRGFWCTLSELEQRPEEQFVILPRLKWLAPTKAALPDLLDRKCLQNQVAEKFRHETMPVLVSAVSADKEAALETARGFIVPDDWRERAGQRISHF
jgi:hypothetical protein